MRLAINMATAGAVLLLASLAVAQTAPAPAAPSTSQAKAKSVAATAKTKADANALTCADFQRNPDGDWTPTHEITIRRAGLIVTLKPGEIFGEGSTIIGLPLADMLDKQC